MLAFSDGFTSVHPCIFALPQTIISSFAKPWEKNKMKRVRRISPKVILFFHFFLQQTKLFCQEQWQFDKWQFDVFFTEVKYFFFSYLFSLTFGSCRSAMINIVISNKSTEEKCFLRHKSPQLFPWHYY